MRGSAYPAARTEASTSHPVDRIELEAAKLASRCHYMDLKSKKSTRPDVTEARVVVSGGERSRTAKISSGSSAGWPMC